MDGSSLEFDSKTAPDGDEEDGRANGWKPNHHNTKGHNRSSTLLRELELSRVEVRSK